MMEDSTALGSAMREATGPRAGSVRNARFP
ncbi:hypothetical protein LMG19282_00511 [Cupriavidus campinensis]|nr:hypothetical protein LMG19282_00511 [Cupriavidus campinensis]